ALHARLAADAARAVEVHDAVGAAGEGDGRADGHARRVVAVIAAQHREVAPRVRPRSLLDVLHPRAERPERDLIFFLARHRARVTADALAVVDHEAIAHAASYSNKTCHQTRTPVSTITMKSMRLSVPSDSRRLASAPSCAPGTAPRATTSAGLTISANTTRSQASGIQRDATAPASEPAAMATPPVAARRTLTARWRPWAMTPETTATKTWTMVIAATALTSSRPTPMSGG